MDITKNYLDAYKVSLSLLSLSPKEMEKAIDSALEKSPFTVEASSLEEKLILFERIILLLNSNTGKELFKEAQEIAKKDGKIIVKEESNLNKEAIGFVDLNDFPAIHIDPKLKENLHPKILYGGNKRDDEWWLTFAKDAQEQNYATSCLAHELRHIIQFSHPDSNISTSMENAAKRGVLIELGAAITDICYNSEFQDSDSYEAGLYQGLLAHQKKLGKNDEQAQKMARTTMALLYLTNAQNMDSLNPNLIDNIHNWNKCYKRRALFSTLKTKYSSDSESQKREENFMNYLCDSVGIDRSILKYLDNYFDKNKDGHLILDNLTFEQETDKKTTKMRLKLNTLEEEKKYTDGVLTHSLLIEENSSTEKLYYPDETTKSILITDKKKGWSKTEFDKEGNVIKEESGKIVEGGLSKRLEKLSSSIKETNDMNPIASKPVINPSISKSDGR